MSVCLSVFSPSVCLCLCLNGFPLQLVSLSLLKSLYMALCFPCRSVSLSFCLSAGLLSVSVSVCVRVCAEWICMRASGVTLLSHAKASVEQIGLVGCRDSIHISLNKSAVLQPCACVRLCV